MENKSIMYQEIMEQPEKIEACLNYNKNEIMKLAKKIKKIKPEYVVFSGRGTSYHAGLYGKYLFERYLGIPGVMANPSIFTKYSADLNYKNCVIFGISQSGAAKDVKEVLNHAKGHNCTTVSITNMEGSLISRSADFHMHCNTGIENSVAATKTFTAMLSIILAIVYQVSMNEDLKMIIPKISASILYALGEETTVLHLAKKLNYISHCVFLARGSNYPVALEGVLKMQETIGIQGCGYSFADFLHGPIAMLKENTPIIVFATDKNTLDNAIEMTKRLMLENRNIIVFTPFDDFDDTEGIDNTIKIKSQSEELAVFEVTTMIQTLVSHLSILKKCDPDTTTGLSKVTVTY